MRYNSRAELDLISKAGVHTYFGENGNPIVRMNAQFWLECEREDTAFTIPVMATGNWEAWNAVAILNELQNNEQFLDVGANVGYYTLAAMHNLNYVRYFEPNPEIFDFIQRSIDLNGNGMESAHGYQYAVGEKEDKLILHTHEGHSGGASLVGEGEGIEVPVVPLDVAVTPFITEKQVIKVDVEGFEREVWNGAERLRNDIDNVWFLEWVPVRHGAEYNREWLTEVLETHDLQMVNYDGTLRPVGIEEALKVKFETIVFRKRTDES